MSDNAIDFSENEPMANHTTFKIGGGAAVMVFPKQEREVQSVVKYCTENNIRLLPLGNGSNMLVSDDGVNACVVSFEKNFNKIELVDSTTIFAQSGAPLVRVCRFALENSLTGLEFAFGIPGSCGGAAFMNAGAYGGEMKQVMPKCCHVNANGTNGALEGEALNLSYRHSAYGDNGAIITGVYFKLQKGNKAEIKTKMDDFMARRKEKQPLEYPSAGSFFKRPTGYFAGALIEECNLKGKTIGGAQVSEKHAGFIINIGGATFKDVMALSDYCSAVVLKEKGVKLEREVRVIE